MWKEWERILKPDGMVVMTASQPFTSKLILKQRKTLNTAGCGIRNLQEMEYLQKDNH
jgi:ubiquinone/menaquinone biosynthesis C-methylase UbiE